MLNDKIILDNVEYQKMIEDLEAFKKEKEKRQIYRLKRRTETTKKSL